MAKRKNAPVLLSKRRKSEFFGEFSPCRRSELSVTNSRSEMEADWSRLISSARKWFPEASPEVEHWFEECAKNSRLPYDFIRDTQLAAGDCSRGFGEKHCSVRLRIMLDSIRIRAQSGYIGAERKALNMLLKLLSPSQRKSYVLSGAFVEKSERSRVTYLFRKGYPLLALSGPKRNLKPLCGLCLHPKGYYRGTFVGALPPSDEVRGHLLLLRADEFLLWRKAEQHQPDSPASGI